MDPHRFEHDDVAYEVAFERTQDGWLAHIRRAGEALAYRVAFPDGGGYDPADARASLVAGCEAAAARLPPAADPTPPTRH